MKRKLYGHFIAGKLWFTSIMCFIYHHVVDIQNFQLKNFLWPNIDVFLQSITLNQYNKIGVLDMKPS